MTAVVKSHTQSHTQPCSFLSCIISACERDHFFMYFLPNASTDSDIVLPRVGPTIKIDGVIGVFACYCDNFPLQVEIPTANISL